MNNWNRVADDSILEKTVAALKVNGITSLVTDNAEEAKKRVLKLLPAGVEVMTMQSVTLRETGIAAAIDESGDYKSIRRELSSMDRSTQGLEMQKLGAAPEWTVGSVHAVTQEGHLIIASNTGSQLGPYAYASPHVVWVVGAQKIVKNLDEGIKRIYDYILPLESKRLSKQIGKEIQSNVSKLLIFNKEVVTGRATLVFVKKPLGF